jgi:SAM-dependent methyltransferase
MTGAAASRYDFADSAAYERFVGSWGRAAGAEFLAWLKPPPHATWLDVGCGTGLFTELICDRGDPAAVIAIDQAAAQIDYARRKPVAERASFRVGDAQLLPFEEAAFDIVVSALVINFIPDRLRALTEMRRVTRPDGMVAGYVWDFVPELSPSGPFRLGLQEVMPGIPALPGAADSTSDALCSLFQRAGFDGIVTCTFDVPVEFPNFEAFWIAQTPSYAPTTQLVAALPEQTRRRLVDAIQARLRPSPNGSIRYTARANAIKAFARSDRKN